MLLVCLSLWLLPAPAELLAQDSAASPANAKSLEVLFVGNSYTARHHLAEVVKGMAEAGNPGLTLNVSTVIYGGRTLADHWRLGTQNIVNQHAVTRSEVETTLASLEEAAGDPKDRYAKAALARQREFLKNLETQRKRWDVIVLQSYRDDLNGDDSLYAQYAPKFAELAKAQGARVILYETTPTTQNAEPLKEIPDPAPVMKKAREIGALANRVGASAAPMSLVGLRCQTERPDLTLRFVNDGHLNQTMAYLTACALYAALFDRTPVGLPTDSVTDIRFLDDDIKNREKDRDGNPITRKFSDKDRGDLQRIAWEGYQEFEKLRRQEASHPAK
jgi:hypothetical protein